MTALIPAASSTDSGPTMMPASPKEDPDLTSSWEDLLREQQATVTRLGKRVIDLAEKITNCRTSPGSFLLVPLSVHLTDLEDTIRAYRSVEQALILNLRTKSSLEGSGAPETSVVTQDTGVAQKIAPEPSSAEPEPVCTYSEPVPYSPVTKQCVRYREHTGLHADCHGRTFGPVVLPS